MAAHQLTPKSLLLLFQPVSPRQALGLEEKGREAPPVPFHSSLSGRSSTYQPGMGLEAFEAWTPPPLMVGKATQSHWLIVPMRRQALRGAGTRPMSHSGLVGQPALPSLPHPHPEDPCP